MAHHLPQQAVNPSYLETNAQTHRWVFGAIAELIDNSQDAAATDLYIDQEKVRGKLCLVFQDNGHGMDFDNLNKMLGLGFVDKKIFSAPSRPADKPVGQYGNGFKSGSMRLAKDALVLTVSQEKRTASVGLLSQTMHKDGDLDKMVIPMVNYTLPNFELSTDQQSEMVVKQSLEAIFEIGPFHSEQELKCELRTLLAQKPAGQGTPKKGTNKGSGTKIFLFTLKKQKGMLELDFKSDPRDIRNPETQEETDERTQHNSEKAFEYKQSLRRYCSILYEKPKMAIHIRGEKVKTCYLRTTLKYSKTYKYKPKGCKDKNGGCEIRFGKKTKANEDIMEDYGVMFYHRNRLITPYMKLGCQKKSKGLDVVGVVDVSSVLQPEHNKQRFVDNIPYRSAITAFSSRLDGYCGFAAKIDTTIGKRENPWFWAQCDNCQKWRRLPGSSDTSNLSERQWFCRENPDQTRNRCEAQEEEHKDDEFNLADFADDESDMDCDESSEAGPSHRSTSTWQPETSYTTWQSVASTSTLRPDESASTSTLRPDRSASTSSWQSASSGTWPTDESASDADESMQTPTLVTPKARYPTKDPGSGAKAGSSKKSYYDSHQVNCILREVIKQNPYKDKTRWDTVVTKLSKSCEELSRVTKDIITDKINRDLKNLKEKGDIAQRKGTFEEKLMTRELLKRVEKLKDKGNKPKKGSGSSQKVKKQSTVQTTRSDFFKGLARQLLQASESSFEELLEVAQSAEKAIAKWPVSVRKKLVSNEYDRDEQAECLFPSDGPDLRPVRIFGDGNCLPRCASLLSCGSEDSQEEMRCRIVIELAVHEDFYLCDDNLSYTSTDDNLSSTSASYAELSDYYVMEPMTPSTVQRIYRKEVKALTKSASYMGVWQLHAVCSILKSSIFSIYPEYGGHDVRRMLHRQLNPRSLAGSAGPRPLYGIMWSRVDGKDLPESTWRPNHFVVCLPTKSDQEPAKEKRKKPLEPAKECSSKVLVRLAPCVSQAAEDPPVQRLDLSLEPAKEKRKKPLEPATEKRKKPLEPATEKRKKPLEPATEKRKKPLEPATEKRKKPLEPATEKRKKPPPGGAQPPKKPKQAPTDIHKMVIVEVAKLLGSDGDQNFYLQLGLSIRQFEEARAKHRESLIGTNTECLTMWWFRQVRCADAINKLKAALSETDRADIVEKIDSILATENVKEGKQQAEQLPASPGEAVKTFVESGKISPSMGPFNDSNQIYTVKDDSGDEDDGSICSRCAQDDLSSADASDDALSSDQCNGENRPVVSKNWQVSDYFREQGGTLCKPGSDVLLEIPPGAVKTGTAVTVHAAVCADLEYMHRKIGNQLSTNDEQIVTPLAEYWVEENLNWRFECPVAIRLPHFLPPDYDADDVHVYHMERSNNGQVKLSRVQRRTENANCKEQTSSTVGESDDLWFLESSQSDYVTVHTHHFSGYVCTYCNKSRTSWKRPQLFARGRGSIIDCEARQQVDVFAYVWDKRINIPDFAEEVGMKTKYLSDPVTIDILNNVKKTKLQMSLTDCPVQLKHRMRSDGRTPLLVQKKTYDLLKKFGCKKCIERRLMMTHMQHNWQLEFPPGHKKQTQVEVQVGITIQDTDDPLEGEIPETALSIRIKHQPTSPVNISAPLAGSSTCTMEVDGSISGLQSGERTNRNMSNHLSYHVHHHHSTRTQNNQLLGLEGPDGSDDEVTFKFVPKTVILEVARMLGNEGDKNFYMELGLSSLQFEDAERHRKGSVDRNTECLTMWCRKDVARCKDAVDKLKAALSERDRKDIVEKIDSILKEKEATDNVV